MATAGRAALPQWTTTMPASPVPPSAPDFSILGLAPHDLLGLTVIAAVISTVGAILGVLRDVLALRVREDRDDEAAHVGHPPAEAPEHREVAHRTPAARWKSITFSSSTPWYSEARLQLSYQ